MDCLITVAIILFNEQKRKLNFDGNSGIEYSDIMSTRIDIKTSKLCLDSVTNLFYMP